MASLSTNLGELVSYTDQHLPISPSSLSHDGQTRVQDIPRLHHVRCAKAGLRWTAELGVDEAGCPNASSHSLPKH